MSSRAGVIAVLLSAALAIGIGAAAEHTATQPADDTSRCVALDSEWKAAEAECSTNANLGRARALAREGETKCGSPDAAQHKLGVSKYESALRLCHKAEDSH